MKTICTEIIPTANGTAIFDINTIYVNKEKTHLLQQFCFLPRSDTFSTYFRRTSQDNGGTWSVPEVIYEPEITEEGTWRYTESALMHDAETGRMFFFYNYALYKNEGYSEDRNAKLRIFYQISDNHGKTFSEPIQLIAEGYDSVNWAPGIYYGKNCALISFCAPAKIKGKIILPAAVAPINNSGHASDYLSAACFSGELQNDKIKWTMSNVLNISPELSTRGLCEPAVAELKDGRILMIMRGSNPGGYGKISAVPSRKWYSFSSDGGKTWSAVKSWTYSDGELFFSPASGSRLIRNSKNDVLYWIGNITSENPQGNLPRRPLVIAEVDEISGCIIKESARTVADKEENHSEYIQFSNFRVYEDYITKEFVIVMPHIGNLYRGGENYDLTSPGYAHRFDPTRG
ncbi:MAG: sialidase family protein [Victivallaceae bacterium]|jgi:hypothetical protein